MLRQEDEPIGSVVDAGEPSKCRALSCAISAEEQFHPTVPRPPSSSSPALEHEFGSKELHANELACSRTHPRRSSMAPDASTQPPLASLQELLQCPDEHARSSPLQVEAPADGAAAAPTLRFNILAR